MLQPRSLCTLRLLQVQTLRQVLPGAKELRKLVVEQLTYFFKEATLQKDVPLSTEGNKEDTLYLIVKGRQLTLLVRQKHACFALIWPQEARSAKKSIAREYSAAQGSYSRKQKLPVRSC